MKHTWFVLFHTDVHRFKSVKCKTRHFMTGSFYLCFCVYRCIGQTQLSSYAAYPGLPSRCEYCFYCLLQLLLSVVCLTCRKICMINAIFDKFVSLICLMPAICPGLYMRPNLNVTYHLFLFITHNEIKTCI